jgi:hypothetical protein
MKYLLTIMIISLLSCKKESEPVSKYNPPPTVTNIAISSELINGVAHPKFTITLNVPDTAAVVSFWLTTKDAYSIPYMIPKPKTGTYALIDSYNSYPPVADKKTYASFYLMEDNSAIYNSNFDVN